MPSQTLMNALMGPRGPVDVSKIEIEILPDGKCRWILWAMGRRIYSAVAAAGQMPAMLEASRILIDTAHGVPPVEG